MLDRNSITESGTYKNDNINQYELWIVDERLNYKQLLGTISYDYPTAAKDQIERMMWNTYLKEQQKMISADRERRFTLNPAFKV